MSLTCWTEVTSGHARGGAEGIPISTEDYVDISSCCSTKYSCEIEQNIPVRVS